LNNNTKAPPALILTVFKKFFFRVLKENYILVFLKGTGFEIDPETLR
jgi:hypothetical protein